MSEPAVSLQDTYAPRSTCFGCGPANADGLQLKSFVEGEQLVARWTPRPRFEAFADTLNGGIIGVLLDCHCNWTAAYHLMQATASDHPPCTVTAEYKVTFAAPTDATTEVTLIAWLAELGTRSAKIQGELRSHGVRTASCDAVFVKVKPGHPAYHRW
ncbi:MAG: PaaI family thioesterase [Planctomycetota bacterium]